MTDSNAASHSLVGHLPRDESQPDSRSRGGDRAVDPADLYRTHATFVWRTLRRLGVPEAHLEDAAHEVFLVVCRRQDDLQDPGLARSWLYGIARRVALETGRNVRRHGDPAPESHTLPAHEPLPDRDVENREAATLARALLEEVDERFRTVLVMAEIESMSGPEIAAALDLKLNTVYSRLRAGRNQFREALARHRAREQHTTAMGRRAHGRARA